MTRWIYVLMMTVAGCDGGAPPVTATMIAGEAAPAYGDTPFPTDAVRDGDRLGVIAGLEAIVGANADLVASHVATLDGFGLRPVVEVFVDGVLDPDSIPAHTAAITDAAVLIDVDPASVERGRVIAMDWRYDADRGAIAGAPAIGEQLREGTRYAAVVTTAIRAIGGDALGRAPELDRIVDAPPARWQTTATAHAELDATPALAGRIAAIAVFTTEHATAALVAARTVQADADAVPPPVLAFPDPSLVFKGQGALDDLLGVATRATDGPRAGLERWGNDNPTGIAHDHVGVIATGTMTVARFRSDDTDTDGPEDETFQLDPATGAPRVIAIDTIPVTFALPAAPPPDAGYPVLVLGHGLGNSRHHLLAFAEPLTAQGYALAIIDMVGHGSRFDPTDNRNNLAGQIEEFSGDPLLRDGFGDITGPASQIEFFEKFRNVSAVRDGIRQSALDLSRLAELLRQPDLDLSALRRNGITPRLDTARIAYLGESFGTVVGTVLSAIDPAIDLFVLDVPGGGILDLLLPGSPAIGGPALPLIDAIFRPVGRIDRFNPMIGLMQAVIEGGDPLAYAPHVLADRFTIAGEVLAPRSVVCIEVVGDEVLANTGTDALVRGLGLAVLSPHLEVPAGVPELASPASGNRDGQTAILVQYAPATHGANWTSETGELRYLPGFPADGLDPFPMLPAPITIANPIYETFEQVAELLATHRAGDAPVVRSTHVPVHDFDGDGTPDADDPAPLDPSN
jgi:hypothetical protein